MSEAKILLTPEIVAARLKHLALRRTPSLPLSPLHAAYREAAAVLVRFDPATLRPHAAQRAEGPLPAFLAECEQQRSLGGHMRWSLRPEIRREVLGSLVSRGVTESALAANPARPDDPAQRQLEAYLRGSALPLEEQSSQDLAATLQIYEWLAGVVQGLPDRERLVQRIEREDLLAPLRRLAGEHFQGRVVELEKLHEYVETPGLHAGPPLVVHSQGGMGKSTLVARFALDRLSSPTTAGDPFAYLDFDHPSLTAAEPLFLLVEIFRQIGIQYPAQRSACEAARVRISNPNRRSLESIGEREEAVGDLVGILRNAEVEYRPFLLLLDTFEQMQRFRQSFIGELWNLLEILRSVIPGLSVIVAGRNPVMDFENLPLPLGELDEPAAMALLRSRGVLDEKVARVVFEQVRGNPLSLRLAAEVVKAEGLGAGGLFDAAARSGLFFHVRDARVQGQLHDRILNHIPDVDARKLAHPGLVLRVVTPMLIRDVLAGPCGIKVKSLPRAEKLFEKLRLCEDLVTMDRGVLRHRPDVRGVMLDLLRADQPEKVREIHAAAVAYYVKRPESPEDRAEEIYHRLCLGEDPGPIGLRWIPGVEPFLMNAVEELPRAQRGFLQVRLGFDLDAPTRQEADIEIWEQDAEKRIRERLKIGREESLEEALRILTERDDRSERSHLLHLEAEVLMRLDRLDEARRVSGAALAAAVATGDQEGRLALLRLRAGIEERRTDYLAALRALEEAGRLAKLTDDILEIDVERIRLSRLAEVDESKIRGLEDSLAVAVLRTTDASIQQNPGLYGVLGQALKDRYALIFTRVSSVIGKSGSERPQHGSESFGRKLTGQQVEALVAALLSAFPTRSELYQMVRFGMEENLEEISLGGSLKVVAFEVVVWAEAHGRIGQLVSSAVRLNPGNRSLRAFALESGIVNDSAPEGPVSQKFGVLSHQQIIELHSAAISVGLSHGREALFAGLDPAFVGSLRTETNPAAQLLSDIYSLNNAGRLSDGTVPLRQWLMNAEQLTGIRPESKIFRQARIGRRRK